MLLRISESSMIRVTVEASMSRHYPLFRLRWIIFALQAFCLTADIIVAARFSRPQSIPVWSLMAAFGFFSMVLCLWDLSAHGKDSSPPNSPQLLPQGYNVANNDQSSLPQTSPRRGASSSQHQSLTPAKPVDDTDVISVSADDERLPFLPPQAEADSKKSDDDDKEPSEPSFRPNKVVTALDFILALSLALLYIANMIVESLVSFFRTTDSVYFLRNHALVATIAVILLHLHCFFKQVRVLRKNKGKGGYQRLRGGAVRI